jgi:predicted oxidoreductase
MNTTVQLHPALPAFSRIVYGAWRMNDGAGSTPAQALEKIELCLDQGITTFDHADIYGNYSCEQLFGDALRLKPALKSRMQLVSKCDIMLLSDKFPERRVKYYDTSAAHIEASVDSSLRKLGVERLDVLLIHRPDPFMDAAETGDCLDRLVQAGKIGAAGVSNFKAWDWNLLQSFMKTPLVTQQLEISLLERSVFLDGTLAQCQQNKVHPMAWSPLAGGNLFGQSAAALRVQPALQRLANAFGVTPDAVAIAWLLAHPSGILPVMGTNHPARIRALSDAWRVKMDRETWFELWTLAAGHEVP